MKWEINRVSTPERIFEKIKTELAQPVGVVLFGADCDFKNEVKNMMKSELRGLIRCYANAPNTAALVKAFKKHSAVAVVLNTEESSSHELRHELVKVMQNAGAVSVVGIYAKAEKYSPKALVRIPGAAAKNRQIAEIEQSNPTVDGLDYLIVVHEE